MKRIQIQKALLLSLLFSSALYADTIDRVEYKVGQVLKDVEGLIINGNTSSNCTSISQTDFVSGVYTISDSGAYCVTENLTGNIIIGANSVCIDLQCHNVSAGSGASAFTVAGQNGIRISNGSISNSNVAGILATNSTGVQLSNLFMNQNNNDAIQLYGCSEVNVYDVNIFGSLGVRALGIIYCNEVVVENCQMGGFVVSTGTGILEIISSNVVAVRNVEVANNNFVAGPVGGGIHLVDSANVVIEHSSSNFAIGVPGNDPAYLIHGILIDTCSDCTITDCQMSGNTTNGVEIIGTYGEEATLAILECTAMNNGGIGFDINASAVMLLARA